jgi:serine/threonine protein kinase
MGFSQSVCCHKQVVIENEERFEPVTSFNPLLYTPKLEIDSEVLETFEFSYSNILKYLSSDYEINYKQTKNYIEKLENLEITQEDLENTQLFEKNEALTYNSSLNNLLILEKKFKNIRPNKFILKSLNFNYDKNLMTTPEEIKTKIPLQYHINKNIFKELRITRNHNHQLFIRCKGYAVDEVNCKIHLLYEFYENSLFNFIKNKLLDFTSRIRVMKNLIELVKALHTDGIISLDLACENIRFSPKKFHLKLSKFVDSFDMKSGLDIDRNSKMEINKVKTYYAPEVALKQIDKISWHCDIWSLGVILSMMFCNHLHHIESETLIKLYKSGTVPPEFYQGIEDVYLKSFVIGLLRMDPCERPNIFEIIDVYNKLIEHLNFEREYYIEYTKDDVFGILIFN